MCRLPTLLLLICPMAAMPAIAAPDYGAARVAQVVSVYDADTFRANIEGWPPIVGMGIGVRVAGIDAPEMRGRCPAEIAKAKEARQFVVGRLRGGGRVELRHLRRDKYFRLLATVLVDGEDLGAALIQADLARPYDGGTKRGWCP